MSDKFIEEITLNTTPFINQTLHLNKINFIFGLNGSGKTTISRDFTGRSKDQNSLFNILVFNVDFVKDNFKNTNEIKGVFTFGKDANIAQGNIKLIKDEIIKNQDSIHNIQQQFEEVNREKDSLQQTLYEQCWKIKKDLDNSLLKQSGAPLNSKEKFASFFAKMTFSQDPIDEKQLTEECKAFNSHNNGELKQIDQVQIELDLEELIAWLKESIVSTSNSQISSFFRQLNNLPWVQQGIGYVSMQKDEGILCPFCQQPLDSGKIESIRKVFDDEYKAKINKGNILLSRIGNMIDYYSRLSFDSPLSEGNALISNLKLVLLQIKSKLSNKLLKPEESVDLGDDLLRKYKECVEEIGQFNRKICSFNKAISDRKGESRKLTEKCKEFILEKLTPYIESFNKAIENLNAKSNNISSKKEKYEEKVQELTTKLKNEEARVSNVEDTVVFINKILKNYNFLNFSLKCNEDKKYYSIIRNDGSNVVDNTLSEGEKSLVSFLYFYSNVRQEMQTSGKRLILVFDDPVSSLDSQSLFLISSMIKNLSSMCLSSQASIAQMVLLTHNVYFFREITELSRKYQRSSDKSYFLIRKKGSVSEIDESESNPIRSSYQLLWDVVRSDSPNVAKLNCMRQILSYYFNFIGGDNYEQLIDRFEDEDKLIARSLISAINQGSHVVPEDIDINLNYGNLDNLEKAFYLFFKFTNQEEHYNMMMKNE